MRSSLKVLAYAFLFGSPQAFAADLKKPESGSGSHSYVHDSEGLRTNLPTLSREQLRSRLAAFRAILQREKAAMGVREEDARFDAKDAVITLVMPGGLLYAAYRKTQHIQVQNQADEISKELGALRSDLVAFRLIAPENLVAEAMP
jgi:hypothetical protein